MFLCYTDESGDTGAFDHSQPEKSGTQYFILTGIIIEDRKWKHALDLLKAFRKRIAKDGFLKYDVEFHCSELVDPHKIKEYSQISVPDRWKLIQEFAKTIGDFGEFHIIAIVINKSSSILKPEDYHTSAITELYRVFDNFLQAKKEYGLIYLDRSNEKKLATHARKILRISSENHIENIKINWIIEDPIFKNSADSIFIQAADVVAYSLKEQEFPVGARKKFHADRIFKNQLNKRVLNFVDHNADGIIRT